MGENGTDREVLKAYKETIESEEFYRRQNADSLADFHKQVQHGMILYHACLRGIEFNHAKLELDDSIEEIK